MRLRGRLPTLVIHSNLFESHGLFHRAGDVFIQISALSTVDGKVVAYHGCNG